MELILITVDLFCFYKLFIYFLFVTVMVTLYFIARLYHIRVNNLSHDAMLFKLYLKFLLVFIINNYNFSFEHIFYITANLL